LRGNAPVGGIPAAIHMDRVQVLQSFMPAFHVLTTMEHHCLS
jgi:hypothetical protein